MFRAFKGDQEDVVYQPRRKSRNDPKPDPEVHTLQWDMARVANNVKARQDAEVRKFVGKIEDKIQAENLLKNSVLFVDCSDIMDKKTVTGLVAGRLASKYLRPVVLLRSRSSDAFGGSCRGYDKGKISSIKEFLEKAGMECRGHNNAAGVNVQKAELADVIAKCNEMLPVDQLVTIHPVDWEIPANELKNEYVREVAENYAVWGNTVPTPSFVITNLRINASQIAGYGETKSFIRFQHNGVTYIKKYCSAGEFDKMTLHDRNVFGVNKKNLVMNIIGQFQLEVWEDKIYPQVKILQCDVVEDDDIFEVPTVKQIDPELAEIESCKKNAVAATKKSDDDFNWDDIEKPKKKKALILDDDDFVF